MRTLSTVRIVTALGWFVVLVLTLAVVATPVLAGTLRCPPDSVKVGPTCVDKYEASVWQIAPTNTTLIGKVRGGR